METYKPTCESEVRIPCAPNELRNQDTGTCHQVAYEFTSPGPIKDKKWVIASTNSEVIGTVSCSPSGEVNDVVVSDSFRGQGLGRKLLETVTQSCGEPEKTLSLNVESDNVPALKLYYSVGFRIVHDEATSGILRMEYRRSSAALNY